MDDLKKIVKQSFKMEMIGTGMYRSLARQYRGRPDLKKKFAEFAEHEAMHGRLFTEFYKKNYGKTIWGGGLWQAAGRAVAFMMHTMSLEKKLKKISSVEWAAVKNIEKTLAEGTDPGFTKIISRILPDEKAHAALFKEVFPG